MSKYLRVMDGLSSNANGFSYKLDEINITETWNPNADNPKEMGGFNFSTEDKILRWLHRGDTIYDVIIPNDAEVILCDEEKGIYRANKIIVSNPRTITDELVIELYKKSNLSNKIIAQCLKTLLWRDRLEISKYIIKDRVNLDNVKEILSEFEIYSMDRNFDKDELEGDTKVIYNILREINNELYINLHIDREPYLKTITEDRIINLTGESGSGKSYYSEKYVNNDNYVVIDTDIVFSDKPSNNKESLELRKIFKDKEKDYLITNFDEFYIQLLNYFKDSEKTIVIDSAQYRNIKDINILKGKIVIMRTSVDTCYQRCVNRYKEEHEIYTNEDFEKYKNKKANMYKWYKSLNKFIERVNNI